jgi:hypothetical protein
MLFGKCGLSDELGVDKKDIHYCEFESRNWGVGE